MSNKRLLTTFLVLAAPTMLASAVLAPGASAATTAKPGAACTAKQAGKTSGALTCTKRGTRYVWAATPTTTAPPATTAAATATTAKAAEATKGAIVLIADTVWGNFNLTPDQRKIGSCVNGSRFPHNSQIVWRTRAIDGATGKDLDDKAIKSLEVTLADGQKFVMKYGPHPATSPTDAFWATSFKVPELYPSGTLGYKIVAVAVDGRTATFEPFKVTSSLLTITDDVLPTI